MTDTTSHADPQTDLTTGMVQTAPTPLGGGEPNSNLDPLPWLICNLRQKQQPRSEPAETRPPETSLTEDRSKS